MPWPTRKVHVSMQLWTGGGRHRDTDMSNSDEPRKAGASREVVPADREGVNWADNSQAIARCSSRAALGVITAGIPTSAIPEACAEGRRNAGSSWARCGASARSAGIFDTGHPPGKM